MSDTTESMGSAFEKLRQTLIQMGVDVTSCNKDSLFNGKTGSGKGLSAGAAAGDQRPQKNSLTTIPKFLNDSVRLVTQKEYSITTANSAKPILATHGVATCCCIILYHAASKTAVIAHADTLTQWDAFDGILALLRARGIPLHEMKATLAGTWKEESASNNIALHWAEYFAKQGMKVETDLLNIKDQFKNQYIPIIGVDSRTGAILISADPIQKQDLPADYQTTVAYQHTNFHKPLPSFPNKHIPFSGLPLFPKAIPDVADKTYKEELEQARLLCTAAADGNLQELAKLLKKINPNCFYEKSFSPLHYACTKNQIQAAEMLIAAGASIGLANVNGTLPLELLKGEKASENKTQLQEYYHKLNTSMPEEMECDFEDEIYDENEYEFSGDEEDDCEMVAAEKDSDASAAPSQQFSSNNTRPLSFNWSPLQFNAHQIRQTNHAMVGKSATATGFKWHN